MRQDVAARKPFVLAAVSEQKHAFTQHTLASGFSHPFKIIIVKKNKIFSYKYLEKEKNHISCFQRASVAKKVNIFTAVMSFLRLSGV